MSFTVKNFTNKRVSSRSIISSEKFGPFRAAYIMPYDTLVSSVCTRHASYADGFEV